MEGHEPLAVLSQPETLGPSKSQAPVEQLLNMFLHGPSAGACPTLHGGLPAWPLSPVVVPTTGSMSVPMVLSLQDINAYNGEQPEEKLPFPIIADAKRELAVKLGMLDPDERDKDGMPLTARVVSTWPWSTTHGSLLSSRHRLPSCPVSVGLDLKMGAAYLDGHDHLQELG